jgi:hypothetical protein
MTDKQLKVILEQHDLWIKSNKAKGKQARLGLNFELRGKFLRRVNLQEADLKGVKFARSDLEKANFRGANLEYASFVGASLRGADFTGANILGVNFALADLSNSSLQKDIAPGNLFRLFTGPRIYLPYSSMLSSFEDEWVIFPTNSTGLILEVYGKSFSMLVSDGTIYQNIPSWVKHSYFL